MDKTYQPIVDDIFSAQNLHKCEEYIISMQRELDKAVANEDREGIRETFNLLAKKSYAVKTLATWRITQRNKGKYTAGVDGICIPKTDRNLQYQIRHKLLDRIDIKSKPSKVKRVYIDKPNGKKRPLGIPTLQDRIHQEILRIALEPIVEYHFSDNSFGFRPKRSCQDAMLLLFNKLCRVKSPRYILEGDIKGCFDNIKHEHIINTLSNWKVPNWATDTIQNILKTDIFHNGEVIESETGTPQGGVISPLLANVALTTLDNFCAKNFTDWKANPIVRYADDFVIICKSELEAKQRKSEISQHLSEKVGLTLSEEKTNITHISKGFNFLGFNFRKYKEKENLRSPIKRERRKRTEKWGEHVLLIKPEKEKVIQLLQNCQRILKAHKTAKQDSIIQMLNPILRGWGMYYRHVVSKRIFSKVDYEVWIKLFLWAKRRHQNKTKAWVSRKYFSQIQNKRRRFLDKKSNAKLFDMSGIPIKRFVMVKKGMRVFDKDPNTIAYWNKREYLNAYYQINPANMRKLFEKQKGKCLYCKGTMTQGNIQRSELHIHHMKPRSLGGNMNQSNLRLLHDKCHREIHAKHSRKEMSEMWDKDIDYINN